MDGFRAGSCRIAELPDRLVTLGVKLNPPGLTGVIVEEFTERSGTLGDPVREMLRVVAGAEGAARAGAATVAGAGLTLGMLRMAVRSRKLEVSPAVPPTVGVLCERARPEAFGRNTTRSLPSLATRSAFPTGLEVAGKSRNATVRMGV
jgi:hypothetical protein